MNHKVKENLKGLERQEVNDDGIFIVNWTIPIPMGLNSEDIAAYDWNILFMAFLCTHPKYFAVFNCNLIGRERTVSIFYPASDHGV